MLVAATAMLTILVKSMVNTSLLQHCPADPGRHPPNSTAWSSSYIVREKKCTGDGLVPETEGDDHVSEGREH